MSRQVSLKTLMTPSTLAVEAAFWKISTTNAREVSSISARLWHLVNIMEGEGDVPMKCESEWFCAVLAVSRASPLKRSGELLSNTLRKKN